MPFSVAYTRRCTASFFSSAFESSSSEETRAAVVQHPGTKDSQCVDNGNRVGISQEDMFHKVK